MTTKDGIFAYASAVHDLIPGSDGVHVRRVLHRKCRRAFRNVNPFPCMCVGGCEKKKKKPTICSRRRAGFTYVNAWKPPVLCLCAFCFVKNKSQTVLFAFHTSRWTFFSPPQIQHKKLKKDLWLQDRIIQLIEMRKIRCSSVSMYLWQKKEKQKKKGLVALTFLITQNNSRHSSRWCGKDGLFSGVVWSCA